MPSPVITSGATEKKSRSYSDGGNGSYMERNSIGNVEPNQFTAVIATTGLSAAVDLGTERATRLVMPATIAGTVMTFQVSDDAGATWSNLHGTDGAEFSVNIGAARVLLLTQALFASIRHLKLRTGPSATPTAQAAAVNVIIVAV